MTIICPVCQSPNSLDTEYCTVCGHELQATSYPTPINTISTPIESQAWDSSPIPPLDDFPPFENPPLPPDPIPTNSSTSNTAILVAKQADPPIAKFSVNGEDTALIGRFDPDSGPVDIDLEGFSGQETVSRHHSELYLESGQWKVKDLGSVNGVFIRRFGSRRYEPRITAPTPLSHGDEIAFGKVQFKFQTL